MLQIRTALLLLAVFWPWLHRTARGPTPTIEPLLVSLAWSAVLLALATWSGRLRVPPRALVAWSAASIALFAADATARRAIGLTPEVTAACLVLAGMLACAIAAATLQSMDAGETPPFAELLAWAWLAAGVASTVIALAQVAGWSPSFSAFMSPSPTREAFGNLRQRNHYATLANLALLALAWLVVYRRRPTSKCAAVALVLLLCAGVAASASRTGAIELLLVLALAAWWHRGARRSARWLLLPLATYGAVAVLLAAAFHGTGRYLGIVRRLFEGVPDCPSRTVLWQNMSQLALERPWTGWGWRELSFAFYQGSFEPRFCALVDNAHNLPLHLAVELGLPFAVLFCFLCAVAAWRGRPWQERSAPRLLAWGVLLLIAVHSLAEFPLWYGPFQMAAGLALGLLAGPHAWPWPRWVGITAAAALTLACGYAAFDWHRVNQLYLEHGQRSAFFRDDTLAKARASWLFRDYVAYAELVGSPLIRENAQRMFELAGQVKHFSPESPVIAKRIAAARLLGLDEEAAREEARWRAAYPGDHAAWAAESAR